MNSKRIVHGEVRARVGARQAALQIVLAACAFGVASRVASAFAEPSGASYLFPPAAVSLVAGAAAGWRGVVGVMLGHFVTPWGVASTPVGAVVFMLVHGATAAVPAWALRRRWGGTPLRVLRTFGWGVVGSQVVSAVLGVGAFVALGRISAEVGVVASTAARWLVADVVAALVLGVPLLVMLDPPCLLGRGAQRLFQRWRSTPREITVAGLAIVAAIATTAAVGSVGLGFPHWLGVLLVAPVTLAAWSGGLGAAIVTNGAGVVSWIVLYLVSCGDTTPNQLEPLYATATVLSVGALIGGLAVSANRLLLERVQQQQRDLEAGFEAIVASLSAAIEAKDPLTDGHLHRVADLAVSVGEQLGLDDRELRTLRFGALLHDIGKIGVPEHILNRPGPLTTSEREQIEEHVAIGVRIIEPVGVLADVLPLVRYHQERYDGRREGVRFPGYFGLAGDAIPMGARILSVVDTWDAMTNDRPYRRALSLGEAASELQREAGAQFDPVVVTALFQVVDFPAELASAS